MIKYCRLNKRTIKQRHESWFNITDRQFSETLQALVSSRAHRLTIGFKVQAKAHDCCQIFILSHLFHKLPYNDSGTVPLSTLTKINYHVLSLGNTELQVRIRTPFFKVIHNWSMTAFTILEQAYNNRIIGIF